MTDLPAAARAPASQADGTFTSGIAPLSKLARHNSITRLLRMFPLSQRENCTTPAGSPFNLSLQPNHLVRPTRLLALQLRPMQHARGSLRLTRVPAAVRIHLGALVGVQAGALPLQRLRDLRYL